MEDELTTTAPELPTEEGVYTETVGSTEIPEFTEEEANDREYEAVEVIQEGGL